MLWRLYIRCSLGLSVLGVSCAPHAVYTFLHPEFNRRSHWKATRWSGHIHQLLLHYITITLYYQLLFYTYVYIINSCMLQLALVFLPMLVLTLLDWTLLYHTTSYQYYILAICFSNQNLIFSYIFVAGTFSSSDVC